MDYIDFDKGDKPLLLVVVDTEEEFDWNEFPDRSETSVTAMDHAESYQSICVEYGLSPCYVVDYPIASQEQGYAPLKSFKAKGQCEIGTHLHPWVSPPFDEELSLSNMYPGNLEKNVEFEKLRVLTEKIEETFGDRPKVYKAGRYGFGPNTTDILQQLGYNVDVSYCPPMNHSVDGGPDYSDHNARPFRFGDDGRLLEIPITGSFVGMCGQHAKSVFNVGQQFKTLKAPGILSRLNIVDRLILSPEGYTSAEHIKLAKFLYNNGQRVFTWSFHSPTVVPGTTSYVQNDRERQVFLDSFKRFFDFFFNQLGGEATTPSKLYSLLESKK